MTKIILSHSNSTGPKKRQKHYPYDENVDEPAKLIEDEAVEIEGNVPADENEPVETIEKSDESVSPEFEE